MTLQIAGCCSDCDQLCSYIAVYAGFLGHNLCFNGGSRIIKIQPGETLFGGLFQIFHQTLITGVVGNHQLKIGVCFHLLTLFFQRQCTAVIR